MDAQCTSVGMAAQADGDPVRVESRLRLGDGPGVDLAGDWDSALVVERVLITVGGHHVEVLPRGTAKSRLPPGPMVSDSPSQSPPQAGSLEGLMKT